MHTVLVYSDSLTWGIIPNTRKRLPFDERCLRFWETGRVVLTPSAEQVRKPIYRGAVEQWKNFEPWLGELKESLGDLANT